ncbi:acyltransferase papA2 [Streptomyces sp. NPDC020965]|uniref:acyltransferase papA2 n=1 Tax=Streptomyces sp. NPDC020965 TaxID=3365105 RepID=UPI0037A11378
MKTADLWNSGACPGRVISFTLAAPAVSRPVGPPCDSRPPAYVQEAHIRTVRYLRERGLHGPAWIGTAFDLPGHSDPDTLQRVLWQWTLRHETLRSGFRWEGDELRRFTLEPDEVELCRTDHGTHDSAEEVCRVLEERLDAATDALSWPNFVYAAVIGAAGTRLYLGFDHTNVDAYSLHLMPDQIHAEYARHLAASGGATPATPATPGGEEPVPTGAAPRGDTSGADECESYESYDSYDSYVDFCEIERAQADEADVEDATVARWRSFVAACDGTLPSFPLDMGVTLGEFPEQRLWDESLVDAEVTAAFDARCRPHGGVLPGLIAASAVAVQEAGGPSVYRTVVPFHTRATSRWGMSVGWYVGAVPVEVATGEAGGFGDLLTMARAALRDNRGLARLPVARALRLLGDDFRPPSPDLFSLLSYVDGRGSPGAGSWEEWNARTLLRVSRGDQVCVWVNRAHDGLQFVARYPATPQARKNMARYVEGLRTVITTVARTGGYLE